MYRKMSCLFWHLSGISVFLSAMVIAVAAQADPNPDSPTPVLISQPDSVFALTDAAGSSSVARIGSEQKPEIFQYGSIIKLYVTNLELMPKEEANAFRVYVGDLNGRTYRFPVLNIQPLAKQDWVYEVTVELRDELKFWQENPVSGVVLARLSWRGLVSNPVKIALGGINGDYKETADAKPTPFPQQPIENPETAPGYVGYYYSGDRARFFEQSSFGATEATDARLRRLGLRVWLGEQFDLPYPSPSNPLPDLALKSTSANSVNGCGVDTTTPEYAVCVREYYSMYPLQKWFFREALYGDAQLHHRAAWALSQIWVVSGVSTQQASWETAYYRQIAKNSFGNYRQLMKDMTLNPAMGDYLDMVRSTKNSPNENYAREIMQLFTVGLFMLNQDGTQKLDGSGQPIPTYTQDTVNNLTKVFTGWGNCEMTAICPNRTTGAPNYKDPMILNQTNHDVTAKTLLDYPNAVNKNIAAGQNGDVEMDQALDNIFYHPNVAPFVSRQLIQHFVTSDPSPAYVGRVAAVFNDNGAGVRGDLKAVIRAILLDPEARGNVKTDPLFGKLREPVQLLTNFLKAFNAASADLSQPSDGYINNLTSAVGQNVFNSPTVFNYYSPDYIIPGTTVNGPEFGLMTTGTAIGRANQIYTMTYSKINVGTNTATGTAINLSEMTALAQADATGNQLLDALNQKLLHGTMSAQMRQTILPAITQIAATNPTGRAQQAIYLVATSSQFQVQR